ncbi:hypothetical protein TNCV_1192791 [Trichonephila clavipes]|nr:hypothetical protein TNCV_1192791 [Trichonephila clavipes]
MGSFVVPHRGRHPEWTIAWNLSTMVVDSRRVAGGGDISEDHTEKKGSCPHAIGQSRRGLPPFYHFFYLPLFCGD